MLDSRQGEDDFILRQYKYQIVIMGFVFMVIGFQFALDFYCIIAVILASENENNFEDWDSFLFVSVIELTLTLCILFLEIKEMQYARNVYRRKFTIIYANNLSPKSAILFIRVIWVLFIIYILDQIYFIYIEIPNNLNNEQFCICHFYGARNQLFQYAITVAFTICQTLLMWNIHMIYQTLKILMNHAANLILADHRPQPKDFTWGSDGKLYEVNLVEDFNRKLIEDERQLFQQNLQNSQIKQQQVQVYDPSSQYTNSSKKRSSLTKCMICLEKFTKHVRLTQLSCSHIFHKQCVNRLLSAESRMAAICPLCRTPINKENLESIEPMAHIQY